MSDHNLSQPHGDKVTSDNHTLKSFLSIIYKSVETITIQQWIFPSVESILVLKKKKKQHCSLYIQHEQYCITHWYKWRKKYMNHFYTPDERWNDQPFICTLAQIYTSKNSKKQQHELHRQSTLANLMFTLA